MMDTIAYVYKCLTCSKYWVVYAGQGLRCPHCRSKDRYPIHTIDPAKVVERFLNRDEEVVADLTQFEQD